MAPTSITCGPKSSGRNELAAIFGLLIVVVAGGCFDDGLREDDVGSADACQTLQVWPAVDAEYEDALADALDELRSVGHACAERLLGPYPALRVSGPLRCAARMHANELTHVQMATHEGRDGSTPFTRARLSGYEEIVKHELIALRHDDAEQVLEAWLADLEHCSALLDGVVVEVGIGHAQGPGDLTVWVMLTGEPREPKLE